MSTLGKVLWISLAAAFALWSLVAFLMAWRWMWRRREPINKSAGMVYQQFGEECRPITSVHMAWIIVRNIPLLFLFSAFLILVVVVHIPVMVWSIVTGKPIPPRDLSELNNDVT